MRDVVLFEKGFNGMERIKNKIRPVLFVVTALGIALLGMPPSMHQFPDTPRVDVSSVSKGEKIGMALEWFVYQRTYNSRVPLDEGRRAAVQSLKEAVVWNALAKEGYANQWVSLGPENYAGRMRAIAVDPNDGNIVYAGAASGGLWKSYDGGASWVPLTDHLPSLAIGSIAIDPNNTQRIIIGTGEGTNNWDRVFGDDVYRSEDGGNTWTALNLPLPLHGKAFNKIVIHPLSADTIFVAASLSSSGGVYKTTNAGKTWQNVISGPARDIVLDPFEPSRLYVAMGFSGGSGANGIYRSDRWGKRFSFARLANGLPKTDSIGRIQLAISPSRPNTLIAVIVKRNYRNNDDLLGVYRTTDGGDSWQRMPASNLLNFRKFMNGQGDYNLAVAFHPRDENIVFVGGISIWRSTNFGESFIRVSGSSDPLYPVHVDQHVFAFDPVNPSRMYVGNDGGMYRCENTRATSRLQWTNLNNGLVTFQFYAMAFDPQAPEKLYGGTQDNGTNKGVVGSGAWNHILGGDGMYVVVDHKNSNIIYAESQFGTIRKSTNGGSSWMNIRAGINPSQPAHWVTPIVMDPLNHLVLYTSRNVVYRTNSGGLQWTAISPDLTGSNSTFNQISSIAVAPSNTKVVYAVTGNGRVWRTTNASSPNPVWERINGSGSKKVPNLYLTRVTVDPVDADIAYVTTSSFDSRAGVYVTFDGGQTWDKLKGSGADVLPNAPVNVIEVDPLDPTTLYVGTDVGMYISVDQGASWKPFGRGFPVVVVDDIKVTRTRVIYAASHGRGMWMTSTVLGVESDGTAPATVELRQNYPNPFGPGSQSRQLHTEISFSLNQRTSIELLLHDTSGKLVKTLLSGAVDAGTHAVVVDGADLTPGVYYYTLWTGREARVKKMVVVR